MKIRSIAPLSLVVFALAACRAAPMAHQADGLPVTALFGPVISPEVIRGRERDGNMVMLLVGATIVRVDLEARRAARVAINVPSDATCWGLARLDDGSVWTLKGRNSVVRIDPDGRVSREIPLAEPHLGLFAAANRLVYQKAMSTPPEAALRAAPPGAPTTEPWSEMTTRGFSGIARAQLSALNMVACGSSDRAERPCWFPHEAAVSLITPSGETRRLPLSGLAEVAPEILLAAENPPRPVRDAFVDRQGRIWVLSSGIAPADAGPGGWILARYAANGAAQGQVRLAEPVRLILRADDNKVLVLTGAGQVGEVTSW